MSNEIKNNLIKNLLKEGLRVKEDKIEQLDEHEILTLAAIMQAYGIDEAAKVITGEHVNNYELLENINDDYDLGYSVMSSLLVTPEELEGLEVYINLQLLGADICSCERGVYTDYGYLKRV